MWNSLKEPGQGVLESDHAPASHLEEEKLTHTAFQRHGGNSAQIQLKQGNSAWISSASLGANLALVIEQKKKLNQHFSFYVEGLEVILVVWLP